MTTYPDVPFFKDADLYGRRIVLDLPFDQALTELTQALDNEGVAVLSQTDMRRCLAQLCSHDFRRYTVLTVAVPAVLLNGLLANLSIGAVLPTGIAVFELADGETAIVVSEPFAPLGSDPKWREAVPHVAAMADQTCDRLARALQDVERAARAYASLREAPCGATH